MTDDTPLRAVLRHIEWIHVRDDTGQFYETCPECWADRAMRGGHTAWCALSAALVTGRTATEAPIDAQGRFMLNAYGRQCYDLGYKNGRSAPAVPAGERETP